MHNQWTMRHANNACMLVLMGLNEKPEISMGGGPEQLPEVGVRSDHPPRKEETPGLIH